MTTRDEIATRGREEWRAVVGLEGFYEVSNHGAVRSLPRIVQRRTRGGLPGVYTKSGAPLSTFNERGHARVSLYDANGHKQSPHVDVLVAEAFGGIPRPPGPAALAERLERLSMAHEATGCRIWIGTKNNEGYGRVGAGGRTGQMQLAHRAAYELAKGKIPRGLVLDHLCRTPACINPDHLEAVTQRENVLRGDSRAGLAMRREACVRGHLWTIETTYWSESCGRKCRVCGREDSRKYKQQRRQTVTASQNSGASI